MYGAGEMYSGGIPRFLLNPVFRENFGGICMKRAGFYWGNSVFIGAKRFLLAETLGPAQPGLLVRQRENVK
jgi:hypothetical protein